MAWVKLFKKPGASSIGRAYQPGSMSSLALTKGLLNEPGQNSCFLNSAVQVLWQLDIFRRSLRQLPGHFCLGDACIFCALKSIFTQFQHSRERALPSDSLRLALAETFKDEQRFQLGFMGDAAECFENILERIHLHIVSDTGMEVCTSKSCITHQKFAMTLYEQSVCWSCGASCDPLPFTELVHYVSTTALCQQVERMLEKSERLRSDMFGELLKAASTIGDLRKCPSDCGQSMGIRRVLMNSPEIVTIGFVWDAEQSDLTEEVIRSLGPHLNLSGLFCRVMDEGARRSELLLVGMVCYSSRHYCAFAFHTKSARWVFFDDATVKEIGSKWKDVVAKCIRGHFQPLLLFYANPDGMPVSNEDAPRQTTLWSRHKPSINGDAAGPDLDPWVRRTEVSRENSSQGPFRHKQQASGSWGNGPSSATRGPAKPMTTSPRSRLREPIRENGPKPPEVRTPHPQRRELTRGQRRQDFRDGAAYAERRTRSASPPETVHQTKTLNRMERTSHYSRPAQEPRPHSCRKQESLCQSEAGAPRSRARTWRPVREVLNVDSVLSELERRQQSPRRKACTHQRVPRERERERPRAREERRPKSLMTIYEDEQRQESGRHSSLESEGREGQLRGSVRVRGANWTIQRTESGYESSDRLSNGSTNPDSPIVENFVAKELRPVTEGHFPRSTPMPTRPVDSSLEVSPSSPAGAQPGGPRRSPSSLPEVGQQKGSNTSPPHFPIPLQVLHMSYTQECQGRPYLGPPLKPKPKIPSENQSKTERKDFNCQDVPVPKPSPCLRGTSRAPLRSPERGSGSDGDPAQQDVTDRGYLTGSPALQALGKTSSSEWNSSDDLMGPLSEQEDSAYRSSNSETAPTPVPVQGVGVSPLPIRKCSQRQTFRPRLLQEPSQTSPRPSAKALDAPAGTSGQGVSLTTYFSVDHCMTDTYRLKYHHRRPRDSGRSLSAESLSPSDLPRSRQETGYSTSRQTIKWNPVTPRGLDEHGFL